MSHKPSLIKGLLTGLVAGIAATLIMDQFQSLLAEAKQTAEKHEKLAAGESPSQIAEEQKAKEQKQQESEGSTEVVAHKIAEAVGYTIPKECSKSAGQAVHYTFGTLIGAAYGVMAEWLPQVTTAGGTAFGTALFAGADEIAVPALHISGPPTEMPISSHLQYWAAHLVYGAALELARTLIRPLF